MGGWKKSRSRKKKRGGEKKNSRKALSEPRFEVSDYFVSLNSTWAITNYVIRARILSESAEKCREATDVSREEIPSETAIKEELNATNIVFVRTCRKPRSLSNYPTNPAKSPRGFRRRLSACTLAKFAGKPEIRGRVISGEGKGRGREAGRNPDHYLNSTARTMLI